MAGGQLRSIEHRLMRLGRLRDQRGEIRRLIPRQLPAGIRFDDAIRPVRCRIVDERRHGDPAQGRRILDLFRQTGRKACVDALGRRSLRASPAARNCLRFRVHAWSLCRAGTRCNCFLVPFRHRTFRFRFPSGRESAISHSSYPCDDRRPNSPRRNSRSGAFQPSGTRKIANPHFPAFRSGHRLFQRPSPGKQFPSNLMRSTPWRGHQFTTGR